MSETSTQKINWKAIVNKIRKEKAILVLGPGAYSNSDGQLLSNQLLENIDIDNNPYIQKYYSDDNFFLFRRGGGRAFTCEKIEDFYHQARPSQSLQQLTEIPFHVMLTLTPDKLLPRAFDQEGFPYQFDFYKKLHEPASIQTPSPASPLIYNLFGCIDDEESLILTHNDLYDYFKSVFARKSMPDKLKHALRRREINCIIFLGVPFEKWYMQLLLRELEIHRNHEDFIRYSANQSLSSEVKSFCTEQFTIQFVENDVTKFIQTLHEHCRAQGILRKKGQETKWNQLRELISLAELKTAIEKFIQLTTETELRDEAAGLSARYRRFERKRRNGVLDSRDIPVQEAQITSDLLELINEAETL